MTQIEGVRSSAVLFVAQRLPGDGAASDALPHACGLCIRSVPAPALCAGCCWAGVSKEDEGKVIWGVNERVM